MDIPEKTVASLIQEAERASRKSYSPYSDVKIGSSILTVNGEIFSGCNIENASYGLTICAERVALFNGVSSMGIRKFRIRSIAIVGSNDVIPYPCGACRQVLSEFCEDAVILVISPFGVEKLMLSKLLPYSFSLIGRGSENNA